MIRGIYTAASGMMVQMERENVISNNIANINTVGYKKDQTVIKHFPEFEIYRKDDEKINTPFEHKSILTPIGTLGTGAFVDDVYTEFTQGNIIKTDNKLDFAIEGKELFVVEDKGNIYLQRSGNFSVDKDGFLVNMIGGKLLGYSADGRAGYVKTTNADFTIYNNGNLINAEVTGDIENIGIINKTEPNIDKLMVVNVENLSKINKIGDGYYSLNDVGNIEIASEFKLHQGHIEESTVNTVKEMVEMITCSRAYETNQKVLTTHSEMLSKVVGEVGKWT
ncbi:MAG: flagellar hook-basal body protein [Fusobacteria bacterium]|nr:flagellar hook-basal body protein [Fusobacteriota bacterium]